MSFRVYLPPSLSYILSNSLYCIVPILIFVSLIPLHQGVPWGNCTQISAHCTFCMLLCHRTYPVTREMGKTPLNTFPLVFSKQFWRSLKSLRCFAREGIFRRPLDFALRQNWDKAWMGRIFLPTESARGTSLGLLRLFWLSQKCLRCFTWAGPSESLWMLL